MLSTKDLASSHLDDGCPLGPVCLEGIVFLCEGPLDNIFQAEVNHDPTLEHLQFWQGPEQSPVSVQPRG